MALPQARSVTCGLIFVDFMLPVMGLKGMHMSACVKAQSNTDRSLQPRRLGILVEEVVPRVTGELVLKALAP